MEDEYFEPELSVDNIIEKAGISKNVITIKEI